ncbi:hypothetical protein H6770_00195 [Candidatus Peribacteria bacterium]|nr:hypothetical protein [Candidatus Peribacteria bacterium]
MKKLGRQLALEQLEDRHMMAGDILTFDGILEDTGFSVRETLYHDVRENIVDGALQMDESVLYVSQEEYVPSEDRPVTFEADITIKSNQLNGMLVAMRSDGETVGQYQTELRNGLTFTIEPTGMSIYDYNVDGGEYIGGGYNHFRQELERDKVYHLVMVDTGSSVRGALYDGETEITSIEGDTHNAIHGGKIILRPQGRLGRLTGTMDNVQISQGEEEEEEVHEEAVDTVFADIGSVLDDVELPAPEAVTIAVEGDTPEQRLLAFQQKVLTLQQQIDALTLEKVDLETDHTRQQALYDEAQELMKQAQEVMEEYDRQHDPEALKVAPSFRVDADRFTPHFFVSYADVPAGYSLQFAGDNVYSLSGSSGRATINYLPRPWNHTYFDLDLLDANGVKVKTITRVKIAGGRVSRVGSLHQSYTLNDLAVAEEIPEDQVISDAAHAEAITQNNDAECAMLEAESAMTALDSSIADLASQIHALEREQIPYNRMFVSPIEDIRDVRERGMFVIKYMSNQPQTYVEVALGQPNNVIIRETMNHPGGTSDTEFVADIRRHAGGSGERKSDDNDVQ